MGYLKSDDFFGVVKFPLAKLIVMGSTPLDKGTGVVTGTLTIKDVTNQIQFKRPPGKKDEGTWFFANHTGDRTKYNIRYRSGSFFDNPGDKTIYDKFNLKVNLQKKTQSLGEVVNNNNIVFSNNIGYGKQHYCRKGSKQICIPGIPGSIHSSNQSFFPLGLRSWMSGCS